MRSAIIRRSVLATASASVMAPYGLRAQQTGPPDKSIKILVGFPAGGGTDVMARVEGSPCRF